MSFSDQLLTKGIFHEFGCDLQLKSFSVWKYLYEEGVLAKERVANATTIQYLFIRINIVLACSSFQSNGNVYFFLDKLSIRTFFYNFFRFAYRSKFEDEVWK